MKDSMSVRHGLRLCAFPSRALLPAGTLVRADTP